jgi:hypothetical protein
MPPEAFIARPVAGFVAVTTDATDSDDAASMRTSSDLVPGANGRRRRDHHDDGGDADDDDDDDGGGGADIDARERRVRRKTDVIEPTAHPCCCPDE